MNRFLSVCPNCWETVRDLPAHLRDTGDATVRREDACLVLWRRRNPDLDTPARSVVHEALLDRAFGTAS